MRYLLLGRQFRKSDYRGVERAHPGYIDSLKEDHPVNQEFLVFLESSTEGGLMDDLEEAKRIAKAYATLPDQQAFEVIGVTEDPATLAEEHQFLGFEVCDNSYSHSPLEWFFADEPFEDNPLTKNPFVGGEKEAHAKLKPIIQLMQIHFSPLRNKHGLFSKYEDASFFVECFSSLRKVIPHYWEHPAISMHILGLWEVS
ncbi:MAG: hypothetical protein KIS80_01790 [Anaerolineales bacterium]|nr:hypothetical protein [Anaerolineales bacterium]